MLTDDYSLIDNTLPFNHCYILPATIVTLLETRFTDLHKHPCTKNKGLRENTLED